MRLEAIGIRVGVPIGGTCSCYAVAGADARILLDFGPGALARTWDRGLLGELDAIVISHMHPDHMLDLFLYSAELTQTLARERWPEHGAKPLYVPRHRGPEVLSGLAAAIGSQPRRFERSFEICEYDDGDALTIMGLELTFTRTSHPELCYAPRITDGGTTIVYGADGAYDDRAGAHAADADLLLLEATYVESGPHLEEQGHMTGEQAAQVADQARARRLILTHLPPDDEANQENLRRARSRFAGPTELAQEGGVYETTPP